MAFHGSGLLALALLGRLFVELAATQLGQDAGLLTGALEAAQCGVKNLVFLYSNAGHKSLLAKSVWHKKPGTLAGKSRT